MSKENEKYEGPGHIVNALGKSGAYSLVSNIATVPLTIGTIAAAVSGKPGLAIALGGTDAVINVGAGITGAVKGWTQATRAEAQHERLNSELGNFAQKEEARRLATSAAADTGKSV